MVVVLVILLVGIAVPVTHELFRDRRVEDDLTAGGLIYQAAWLIPFGTVLLEEIAFRGVLLGLLHRRTTWLRAVTLSSLLFGLWHVLPGLEMSSANPALATAGASSGGRVAGAVVSVVATFVAGYVFCWLRIRSRSVLAPMGLHLATNTFSFTLAYLVLRLGA